KRSPRSLSVRSATDTDKAEDGLVSATRARATARARSIPRRRRRRAQLAADTRGFLHRPCLAIAHHVLLRRKRGAHLAALHAPVILLEPWRRVDDLRAAVHARHGDATVLARVRRAEVIQA